MIYQQEYPLSTDNVISAVASTALPPPPQFPIRLHDMLDQAERDGYQHVVGWLPEGNGFQIHDPEAMLPILQTCGFNQSKWKSFLRQLQNYGFRREIRGPNKGKCTHDLFVKGRRDLCQNMRRIKKWSSADNLRDHQLSTSKSRSLLNKALAINDDEQDGARATTSAPTLLRSKLSGFSTKKKSFDNQSRPSTKNASFDLYSGSSSLLGRPSGSYFASASRAPKSLLTNGGTEQLIWDIQKEIARVEAKAKMLSNSFEQCDFEPLDYRSASSGLAPTGAAEEDMDAAEVTEKMCSIFLSEPSLEETYGEAPASSIPAQVEL